MPKLIVTNFSCIDRAELELSRLTILIGPQASGKSVLSKLIFFFYDILTPTDLYLGDIKPLEEVKKQIIANFKIWFPPPAWGRRRFSIEFSAGEFHVEINRTVSGNRAGKNIRLTLSEYFERKYEELHSEMQATRERTTTSGRGPSLIDRYWRLQNAFIGNLASELKDEFPQQTTFIPAGRSFFTSVGKAVTAFDHGGMLDPVTTRFGRLFTALQDTRWRFADMAEDAGTKSTRAALAVQLFGGRIVSQREENYVETEDGRKVPFSVLSSGQQELLPLWTVLEHVSNSSLPGLICIEEPEAHLFPFAQNLLVSYLASLVSQPATRILITTHSPYVLAKMNTLLKAGELAATAASRAEQARINAIVPKASQLRPGSLAAYAIIDRRLVSIVDVDGLIDADYLDSASGDISREFDALLEIEVAR